MALSWRILSSILPSSFIHHSPWLSLILWVMQGCPLYTSNPDALSNPSSERLIWVYVPSLVMESIRLTPPHLPVSKLALARIPHLAQTSDAVNRQLSCFSSRYMNLLAVFQI